MGVVASKVGIYLCQRLGGHRLEDIMRLPGLSNVGSVSFITTQILRRTTENSDFAKTIQRIIRHIIKHATCPLYIYYGVAPSTGLAPTIMAYVVMNISPGFN